MDGCDIQQIPDGIRILVAGLSIREGPVDEGRQRLVEGVGLGLESEVLLGGVVRVRADGGFTATKGALKPGIVFATGAGGDHMQRDKLVSIHGWLDRVAVVELLVADRCTNGRVKTLEEALCGIHDDKIIGRLHEKLGIFNNLRLDPEDLGRRCGGDILITIELSRAENLMITQISEISWRMRLVRPVAVSREDVDTEDGFGSLGDGNSEECEREDGENEAGIHPDD